MRPTVGETYGYRKGIRTPGEKMIPALVVKLGPTKTRQVKVRWLEGDSEGLEEWINHMYLVCRWEDSRAFISDELNLANVVSASRPPINPREQAAVDEAFDALETTLYTEFSASRRASLEISEFPDSVIRFNLNPQVLLDEPDAFVDRHGFYHGTYQTAMKIALELCKQSPDRILEYARKELAKLSDSELSNEYFAEEGWSWTRSH